MSCSTVLGTSTEVSEDYALVRAKANSGQTEQDARFSEDALQRVEAIHQEIQVIVEQLEADALGAEEAEIECRRIAQRHGIRN